MRALTPEERQSWKATQVFAETVLVWHFGDAVLEDPAFAELSRDVGRAMASDPAIWGKFQGMLAGL